MATVEKRHRERAAQTAEVTPHLRSVRRWIETGEEPETSLFVPWLVTAAQLAADVEAETEERVRREDEAVCREIDKQDDQGYACLCADAIAAKRSCACPECGLTGEHKMQCGRRA